MLKSAPKTLATLPLLEVQDVGYSAQGKPLIDGLNFSLARGKLTAIMGPNGAGKSLTLRLIQGLIAPDSGQILWPGFPDGKDHFEPGQTHRFLVFQKPVLLRRSVAANLHHALKVYGVPSKMRSPLVDKYLSLANLSSLRDRPARVLSGGEQQRLSIVRALAAEPQLLLLDEPTASLDPQATKLIEDLIQETQKSGTTVVLVTHDAGQALRLADEVMFFHRGKVTEHSSAEMFFDNPASQAARDYLQGGLLLT